MPRHVEPESIKEYFTRPYPACCHTCDLYDAEGTCIKFDMQPPEDFASAINACPSWVMDLPF